MLFSRDDLNKLKDGEEIKTKSYSALIWSSAEQTAESLAFLTDIKVRYIDQNFSPSTLLYEKAFSCFQVWT